MSNESPSYICEISYRWQPPKYYATGMGLHNLRDVVSLVIPLDIDEGELIELIYKKSGLNKKNYKIFKPEIIEKKLSGTPAISKESIEEIARLFPLKRL